MSGKPEPTCIPLNESEYFMVLILQVRFYKEP